MKNFWNEIKARNLNNQFPKSEINVVCTFRHIKCQSGLLDAVSRYKIRKVRTISLNLDEQNSQHPLKIVGILFSLT